MKMGMGTRTRRIKRLRMQFPVMGEMEEYASQISDDELFHTSEHPDGGLWLPTPFAHTRDSELRDECNWEVISEKFSEVCPNSVKEMRFAHWGFGWSERIYVRKDDAFALRLTQEFVNTLSDCGVVDDERMRAKEVEELNEYLSSQLSGYPGDDDDEYMERVRRFLFDRHNVCTTEDVDSDMVKDARLNVGHPYDIWNYGDGEECFYCNQPESAACHGVTSDQLEAAGQMRLPV